MDLWATLGISPVAGIGVAAAGIVGAAVLAVRLFQRSRRPRFVGVDLGGRG
jgi:hypothetical protein